MHDRTFIQQVGYLRWASRYAAFQFHKRVLRRDLSMRLPSGASFILPRSHPVSEIYVTGADVDWGSEKLLSRFADRQRDFLDVGANIGYYSNYFAPLVRRVYAFEPAPFNLSALRRNAALCTNIEIIEKAISSRDGVAQLRASDPMTSTLEAGRGDVIDVVTMTIDSFVAKHADVDVGLVKRTSKVTILRPWQE